MWSQDVIDIAKLSGYSDAEIQRVIDEEKESIKVKDRLSSSKGDNNFENCMTKVCTLMNINKVDFTIERVMKGYRIEVFGILDSEVA
tara:strand:+ start:404 stop:664 length:261 start_codon:yes stop_codon:yes gene_type:complete